MKQYIIPLSNSRVRLAFFVVMLFGVFLLYMQDVRFIIAGFGIITFALHELCHLLALAKRHYNAVGIVISIWPPGVGVLPHKPIDPKDSALVYFSGLISLAIPVLIICYTVEFGVIFLIGTFLLSVVDVWYWWQLKGQKSR